MRSRDDTSRYGTAVTFAGGSIQSIARQWRNTRIRKCHKIRNDMWLRILIVPVIAIAAGAQTGRLAGDGVYTKDQANRGREIYRLQCARCHGDEARGANEAPGLTGEVFLSKWRSRSVSALFENVRATMPADRPGSLSASATADVLAYVFAQNKLPAGSEELSNRSETLARIRLATGAEPAVKASAAANSNSAPVLTKIEGQPIETLPPEKSDDRPAFREQTRVPYHASAPYRITTLIDGMPAPWGMAFLPDGEIILTLRLPGSLRILDSSGVLSPPISGVSELASPGSKGIGLLEVALDPDFEHTHRIFFTFFDYVDGTNSNTCVARARLDIAGRRISEAKVIFRGVPAIPTKRLGGKTGGRIAFGKDGSLFVSTGDRSDSPPWDVAQRLDNHLGKILHITADGAPSPDNPFIGKPGVLPEIWAYGIRNAEGMAFDPKSGRLWENEHGPRGGDELNIIEKGKNYGWPEIAHGIDYPGNAIGEGITHKDGMEEPVYYWDPVIAPSGLAFYSGSLFPEWRGSLFVGGLRARMLDRLTIVNDKVVAEEPLLMELKERVRDVKVGPDGAVYVLTDSGTAGISPETPLTSKMLKLTPK